MATAVALATLAIGVWGQFWDKKARSIPEEDFEAAATRSESKSPQKALRQTSESATSTLPSSAPALDRQSVGKNRLMEGVGSTDPELPETAGREDVSVIDRPFSVSASIESQCNDLGSGPGSCDDSRKLLSEFAHEPRDVAWATATEVVLRKYALLTEPNKFSIRNIECRTCLCAYEVASVYGQALVPAPVHPINGLVFVKTIDHGYETNSSREKVTVTLWILARE